MRASSPPHFIRKRFVYRIHLVSPRQRLAFSAIERVSVDLLFFYLRRQGSECVLCPEGGIDHFFPNPFLLRAFLPPSAPLLRRQSLFFFQAEKPSCVMTTSRETALVGLSKILFFSPFFSRPLLALLQGRLFFILPMKLDSCVAWETLSFFFLMEFGPF